MLRKSDEMGNLLLGLIDLSLWDSLVPQGPV